MFSGSMKFGPYGSSCLHPFQTQVTVSTLIHKIIQQRGKSQNCQTPQGVTKSSCILSLGSLSFCGERGKKELFLEDAKHWHQMDKMVIKDIKNLTPRNLGHIQVIQRYTSDLGQILD